MCMILRRARARRRKLPSRLSDVRCMLDYERLDVYQQSIEFLALAAEVPIRSATTQFPLEDANVALELLREGRLEGAAVLVP